MGQRERRRQTDAERMAARYERGRQRDAEARAALVPLAPGERPGWVTISAIVALALAAANTLALVLGSIDVSPGVQLAWIGLLVLAGVGMLLVKYWAVLGFQSILLLQILVLTVLLLRVERVTTALLLVALLALFGVLFYKLIRAMARIQMPPR